MKNLLWRAYQMEHLAMAALVWEWLYIACYSHQTLIRLLERNYQQECWHAAYGVDDYRAIHFTNACLLERVMSMLSENVQVVA